jgi:hypothetical protein
MHPLRTYATGVPYHADKEPRPSSRVAGEKLDVAAPKMLAVFLLQRARRLPSKPQRLAFRDATPQPLNPGPNPRVWGFGI